MIIVQLKKFELKKCHWLVVEKRPPFFPLSFFWVCGGGPMDYI